MESLFEGITSSLYSRAGEDHHHQSRAEKQKQHETTEMAVTEGDTWRITWGSIKTGGKRQLGCPNISSSKAPGGQQRASVSTKLCQVLSDSESDQTQPRDPSWLGSSRCRKKNWSEVAASTSDFQEQRRRDHKSGRGTGIGSQVIVIIVILLGLEWGN